MRDDREAGDDRPDDTPPVLLGVVTGPPQIPDVDETDEEPA
jgi:hypothetical protein